MTLWVAKGGEARYHTLALPAENVLFVLGLANQHGSHEAGPREPRRRRSPADDS